MDHWRGFWSRLVLELQQHLQQPGEGEGGMEEGGGGGAAVGERQSPFEAADQTPALTAFVSAALQAHQALRKVNVCSQRLRLLCVWI